MTKSRLKKIALALLIAIPLIIYFLFSYRPISGTVVDAETGKPVEGALVLVEWTRTTGIGLTTTKSYKVAEVVTDKDGKFTLPGVLNPFVNAPYLTIYKKGYVAWNNKSIFPGNGIRVDFKWSSGYVFKLEQFKNTYSYEDHYYFISSAAHTESATKEKHLFIKAYDESEREKAIRERDLKESRSSQK